MLKRLWLLVAILMLALCPLLAAADVTYTFNGVLGPVLSGPDPLGANGESLVVTATVSSTLKPMKHTADSATYKVPAGAITWKINGTTYETKRESTLKYTLPASGKDIVEITSTVTTDGFTITLVCTVSLAHGSFPKAPTLEHPAEFSPSPQALVAAATADGPGSQFKYSLPGGSTVLGFYGAPPSLGAYAN